MLFPFLRFYANRIYRSQPVIATALLMSGFAVVISGTAYVQFTRESTFARMEVKMLQAKSHAAKYAASIPKVERQPSSELPPFDSAQLVQSLNGAAADAQLPLDEVRYALDESANEPYLRYRVVLRVSTSYPLIRKFSDQLSADLSNVSLDLISCLRPDSASTPVSCDLVFSAFYRRVGHD